MFLCGKYLSMVKAFEYVEYPPVMGGEIPLGSIVS